MNTTKRKRGRPKKKMPERIPDSPENIAKAMFRVGDLKRNGNSQPIGKGKAE